MNVKRKRSVRAGDGVRQRPQYDTLPLAGAKNSRELTNNFDYNKRAKYNYCAENLKIKFEFRFSLLFKFRPSSRRRDKIRIVQSASNATQTHYCCSSNKINMYTRKHLGSFARARVTTGGGHNAFLFFYYNITRAGDCRGPRATRNDDDRHTHSRVFDHTQGATNPIMDVQRWHPWINYTHLFLPPRGPNPVRRSCARVFH